MPNKPAPCLRCITKNREDCDYTDPRCQWNEYVKMWTVGPGEEPPSCGLRIILENSAVSQAEVWTEFSNSLQQYETNRKKSLLRCVRDLEAMTAEVEDQLYEPKASKRAQSSSGKRRMAEGDDPDTSPGTQVSQPAPKSQDRCSGKKPSSMEGTTFDGK